jgi:hypothetical protein
LYTRNYENMFITNPPSLTALARCVLWCRRRLSFRLNLNGSFS